MSRKLNENQMVDIIWGATLMGGGGGGSISSGMDLLNSYKKHHPDQVPCVEMITASEMKDGVYAAATAGMGAPAAIVGVDFSQFAANAFSLLQEVAARDGKILEYNIPVELGGFSIFFPMLLSMLTGKPAVDADGAGRAVPALETLLLHVNGCPTAPCALANGNNDKIIVELADCHNAPLAEKIGRDICGEFGNMVGISGWMVDRDDVQNRIITGSITLCEEIGKIMRDDSLDKARLFEVLVEKGLLKAKVICKGVIKSNDVVTRGGFDFGAVVVEDEATGSVYQINYQNENLLLQKKTGEDTYENLMTVPDLTCMYCIDPQGIDGVLAGMPLSNADAKTGMKVAVAVVKVDPKWFLTETTWWDVWKECMEHIGYEGGYLPFDDVKC